MKKILLLLALAATATAAHAQARAGGNLTSKDYTGGKVTDSRNTGFGVKGGYNYNNVRGTDIGGIDRQGRSDFHAGVYGQLGFNQFSSVQVELLYSRQGFTADVASNGAGRQTYRMDYLMLPVMYVGNINYNLSFQVGPQVSLLTRASKQDEPLGLGENGFHTFDYGGVAGLEYRIGPARVGGRYNLSLAELFQTASVSTSNSIDKRFAGSSIYNNLFQLYVGIGFTQ